MKVNYQKKIVFRNECTALFDNVELENAILWYQKKPTAASKKVYMQGQYPAVSIHNKKISIHRLLMCYWNKRILEITEYVHHKNHNKLDATRENLEIMDVHSHQSLHNKGKTLSEDHKIKIGLQSKKRNGVLRRRKYFIPLDLIVKCVNGDLSKLKASKQIGCSWDVIDSRVKEYHTNPDY